MVRKRLQKTILAWGLSIVLLVPNLSFASYASDMSSVPETSQVQLTTEVSEQEQTVSEENASENVETDTSVAKDTSDVTDPEPSSDSETPDNEMTDDVSGNHIQDDTLTEADNAVDDELPSELSSTSEEEQADNDSDESFDMTTSAADAYTCYIDSVEYAGNGRYHAYLSAAIDEALGASEQTVECKIIMEAPDITGETTTITDWQYPEILNGENGKYVELDLTYAFEHVGSYKVKAACIFWDMQAEEYVETVFSPWSDVLNYNAPSLPAPTLVMWKSVNPLELIFEPQYLVDQGSAKYEICYYLNDIDQYSYICEISSDDLDQNGMYHKQITDTTALGLHYATVRALSPDLDQWRNSNIMETGHYIHENANIRVSACDANGNVSAEQLQNATMVKNLKTALAALKNYPGEYKKIVLLDEDPDSYYAPIWYFQEHLIIPEGLGTVFLSFDATPDHPYATVRMQSPYTKIELFSNLVLENVHLQEDIGDTWLAYTDQLILNGHNLTINVTPTQPFRIDTITGPGSINLTGHIMTYQLENVSEIALHNGAINIEDNSTVGEISMNERSFIATKKSLSVDQISGKVYLENPDIHPLKINGDMSGRQVYVAITTGENTTSTHVYGEKVAVAKNTPLSSIIPCTLHLDYDYSTPKDWFEQFLPLEGYDLIRKNGVIIISPYKISASHVDLWTGDNYQLNIYDLTGANVSGNSVSGNSVSVSGNSVSGNNLPIIPADWTSSDPDIVSVDSHGFLCAKKSGMALITATTKDSEIFTCQVNVTSELREIQFTDSFRILEIGKAPEFGPEGDDPELIFTPWEEAVPRNQIEWIVSDPSVISVDSEGHVTPLMAGDSFLTARVYSQVTNTKLETEMLYRVCKADYAKPMPDGHRVPILAMGNLKVGDFVDQTMSDAGWEFVNPDALTITFAGMGELDLYASHTNSNTGHIDHCDIRAKVYELSDFDIPATLPFRGSNNTFSAFVSPGAENESLFNESPFAEDLSYEVVSSDERVLEIHTTDGGASYVFRPVKAGKVTVSVNVFYQNSLCDVRKYQMNILDYTKNEPIWFDLMLNDDGNETMLGYDACLHITLPQDQNKVYLLSARESSGQYKMNYKVDDGKVLKLVKTGTDVTLVPLKAGDATVTVTASDPRKSSRTLRVKIRENAAASISLQSNKITLNKALKDAAAVIPVAFNGTEYDRVDAVFLDAQGNPDDRFHVFYNINNDNENDKTVITLADQIEKGKFKANLQLSFYDRNSLLAQNTFPVEVSVIDKLPSVTVKQPQKLNLFYADAKTELVVTSTDRIESVTLDPSYTGSFEIEKDDDENRYFVKLKDKSTISGTKLPLCISFADYQGAVTKTISLKTEKGAASISEGSITFFSDDMQQKAVVQVMDNKTKELLDLKDARISYQIQSGDTTMSLQFEGYEDGDLVIFPDRLPEKNTKILLQITHPDWTQSLTKVLTVKVASLAKSKLVLEKSQLLMFGYGTHFTNDRMDVRFADTNRLDQAQISVEPADRATEQAVSDGLNCYYDGEYGQIIAQPSRNFYFTGKKSYKFQASYRVPGSDTVLKKDFKVQIESIAEPTKAVTIKTKGSIDVLDRDDKFLTVTSKFSKLPKEYEVENINLTGRDRGLFEIVSMDKDGTFALALRDNAAVSTKIKYQVGFCYDINIHGHMLSLESKQLSITVKQDKASVKFSGRTVFSSVNDMEDILDFNLYNKAGEEIAIDRIAAEGYEDLLEFCREEDGTFRLLYRPDGTFKASKKYKIKLSIYPEKRACNEKPLTYTYNISIR